MSKTIFPLIVCLALLFFSCKNKSRRLWAQSQSEVASARDYSVTPENAYNDIFLDSLSFEQYATSTSLPDSVAENMRDFYNERNFEFAWFDTDGLTEQALGFRSLYTFTSDSVDRKLEKQLDNLLLHESKIDKENEEIVSIELQLSTRFVQYALAHIKDESKDAHQFITFIPIKKQSLLILADSILFHSKDNDYARSNPWYNNLYRHLYRFMNIYHNGGWDSVTLPKNKWVIGNSYPEVTALKKRLTISEEYPEKDSGSLYTTELERAIKISQTNSGIKADGKITQALVDVWNVSVLKRIEQLLINLERMRWMPMKKEGRSILVNIPEFMLHVSENEKHVMHMPVIVGKEGNNTTMFSDNLDEIVFSPYWNLPSSIVKKEIMPSMQKDANYLARNHMEIVNPKSGGTPIIRQLPGPDNSLGLVKFLFPNSFNIYFHDTPAKSLFGRDQRASSHGCIRLQDAEKMAVYLLQESDTWTPEKIKEAMHSGIEKSVSLKTKVPVTITYYTAWVDEHNQLNFRQDVYGKDSSIAAKMFAGGKNR